MAVAGTLEIQLLANMARLQADMDKAKGVVASAAKNMESAAASIKSAFGALGIGLSVAVFANLIKGSIDAMDKLNDLSKSTGLTVEQLSGLKVAAKQSGGDLDSIATSINKLSVEMGKAPEKFRALGISATDPLEAFKQLSDIFVSIDNPQQRAALGAAALGKAWAGAAPLLSEGGKKIGEMVETGTRLSGVTTEMARAADELNDKWTLLGGTGGMLTRMVGPLLPLLNTLADEMLKIQENTLGTTSSFSPLTEALRSLIIFGSEFAFVWRQIGISMAGVQEQISGFATGGIKGFTDARKMMTDILAQERVLQDSFVKRISEAGKGGVSIAAPDVPVIPGTGGRVDEFLGTGDAAAAKAAKEHAEAIRNKIQWLKAEAESQERSNKAIDDAIEAGAKQNALDRESSLAMEQQIADLAFMNEADRAATIAKTEDRAKAEQSKLDTIRQSLMTEQELVRFQYEQDFNMLNDTLGMKKEAQEEYYALMGRLILENETKQLEIKAKAGNIAAKGEIERRKFAALSMAGQAKDIFGYMADITAGVSQHNRALFEINKVAGIANAIINAYEGISLTLAKYPYPYNIGLAALHAAAAFAQVSAIASTSFGAGGGAPSLSGGTPAPPVTPVTDGTPSGGGQTTIINLQGETFGRKQVRELIEQINEQSRDGGRIVIA
jgi:hypothetical protein